MKSAKISDRAFDYINFFIMTVAIIIVIYPILYVVSSSFSSAEAILDGKVWLFPVGFSIDSYRVVFHDNQVWLGFRNSLIYTSCGVLANLVLTCMAAYVLSRRDYPYRALITVVFAITMYFSGGLIPNYLLVKSLGLPDTICVMFVPNALSVFYVILMRTYFQTNIPDSLREAAEIDGCSDIRFLVSVVLPLSKSIFAVVGLYVAIDSWNAFFNALIYLSKQNLFPLQLVLRNVLMQNESKSELLLRHTAAESYRNMEGLVAQMKYALIVVAALPILTAYPFVQKYFVKGVMIGSIKG